MDDTQITGPATDDVGSDADTSAAGRPGEAGAATSDRANQDPNEGRTARERTAEQSPAGDAGAGDAGAGEDAPTSGQDGAALPAGEEAPTGAPGFRERGRMRRRARFLRRARELAYRDLGGLVFDLHRFAQRNDALVLAKLDTIGRIDSELRALESALAERQPATVLREAGVAACPRCAAIHGSDDRFCPNCGLAMDPRAERPVAGPPAPATPPPSAPASAAAPGPFPAPVTASSLASPIEAPVPASSPSQTSPPASAQTPAASPPSSTAPAQAPAPSQTEAPAPAKSPPAGPASTVDQPTEIIRPPARDQ
jgi:hypothetical protein